MTTHQESTIFLIDSNKGTVRRCGIFSRPRRLESRLLRVLELLMCRAGSTVSHDEIVKIAWEGRIVSVDSVSTAIYQLRKFLGDDAKEPKFISTVPHKGYKWIAKSQKTSSALTALSTWVGVSAGLIAGFIVFMLALNIYVADSADTIYIAPMVNSTGDPATEFTAMAVDATLLSALVRTNPNVIATRNQDANSRFRLESEVVVCGAGPALVLTLIDSEKQLYLWSEYYDFYGDFDEPSMIEHAAKKVSLALARTRV